MKVWILEIDDGDKYVCRGVYADKASAEAAVPPEDRAIGCFTITEWPVFQLCDMNSNG